MGLRQMIMMMRQGKASLPTVLQFFGVKAKDVRWANNPNVVLASTCVDEDEPKVAVTRKEYDSEGSLSVLGVPCKQVTEEWDAMVVGRNADGVDKVVVKDAFITEEIDVTDNQSSALMSLAADIASVRLQPRLITSAFTTPKVNGLVMEQKTGTGVPDGYKLFALPIEGTEVTYTEASASLGSVAESFSFTDAQGTHTFTRSELMQAVAACLASAGVTKCVALGTMAEGVSFNDYMTDTEAMMDGRTSMVGYPVDGGADVVWVPVPYAKLLTMAQTEFCGTKVLAGLLMALGMPAAMALNECALLADGSLKVMTLTDGELSPVGGALSYGTQSLLACQVKDGNARPWIDCGIDGGSMLVWVDNQCVFTVLAAMAKKTMDSLCGLALVGVGEGGGVMSWMVEANREYGIPFGNLVKACAIDKDIRKSFTEGESRWLKSNGSSYFDLGIISYDNTLNGEFRFWDTTVQQRIFGANTESAPMMYVRGSKQLGYGLATTYSSKGVQDSNGNNLIINTIDTYKFCYNDANHHIIVNGIDQKEVIASFVNTKTLLFFCTGASVYAKVSYRNFYITSVSNQKLCSKYFIPINHPTQGATFVDLMQDPTTDAAYPTKVGTFTIE